MKRQNNTLLLIKEVRNAIEVKIVEGEMVNIVEETFNLQVQNLSNVEVVEEVVIKANEKTNLDLLLKQVKSQDQEAEVDIVVIVVASTIVNLVMVIVKAIVVAVLIKKEQLSLNNIRLEKNNEDY
jgi:hypothetical protein